MQTNIREHFAQSENDLQGIVESLLNFAEGRKKFALTGDLGAGKTALVKAFCRRLGVRESVASPTFALVNEYAFLNENGHEEVIHHLDLYRLRNLDEAHEIGIEDYLYNENYCLIEWPEIIEELLPEDFIRIKIAILPDSCRKILFLSV